MPQLTINGAKLWVEDTRTGAETIVFSHGLLWSGRMYDAQVAALRDRYRCVTFDFRGQGQSERTAGGYDMDTLARDAEALIGELGVAPVHFVGLSMGGFIGMRLAARRPQLLRSLVLIATTADPEPARNIPKYRFMSFISRFSFRPLVAPVMKIMFGDAFLADPARREQRRAHEQHLINLDRTGTRHALDGVLTRAGVEQELGGIKVPTLVLAGAGDRAVLPERQRHTAERIPGAQIEIIPRAGHTTTVEEPEAVNAALSAFLAKQRGA